MDSANKLQWIIELRDKASAPIKSMISASDKAAKSVLSLSKNADKMDKSMSAAGKGAKDIKNGLKGVEVSADAANGAVKKLVSALGGLAIAKKAFDFGTSSLEAAGTQSSAERLLANVVGNTGGSKADYEAMLAKASEIQSKTVYGDESMIAGAAELASYISDPEAITSMMDTLANYAAGMSGGSGTLDPTAMTDYATQLGKALNGTYDGLAKKGFSLTDIQKKIIAGTATHAEVIAELGREAENMSEDMQKAAVLNTIIDESWSGLAESMASLPENKIASMNNMLGDLKEQVGNQITPSVMRFVDMINANAPLIEDVFTGIGGALNLIITGFTMAADIGAQALSVVADNWSWISPIILTAAGALAAYNIALFAMNAYTAVVTAATTAASIAQSIYNGTLLACPVTWIAAGIVAIVGAIYIAVAAFNHFTGSAVSATGLIVGAFYTMGAMAYNNFIYPIISGFSLAANFLGNVFTNPVAAVEILFLQMAQNCLSYVANLVHGIENLINKIPGVQVNITSGIDNLISGIGDKMSEIKDESGWKEYVTNPELMDVSAAAAKGYDVGKGVEDTVSEKIDNIFNGYDPNSIDNYSAGTAFSGGALGTADDPVTVQGKGGSLKVDMSDENLKYMRDIAEREYVAKIANNTLAPNVSVSFTGAISQNVDTNVLADYVGGLLREEIATASEGVY